MSLLCGCFGCKKTYEAPEVVKIDYNHRSLMEVPPDIFLSERTLESLLLASNQIPDLPPNLFHCHELKVLDLSDNELSTIPAAIGSLTRLHTLDLSRNAITEVSDAIKNCKNLVTLDLSLNQLVKVPEGISQLVNLEQLLLNDACLEFLHANVGRLTKLRILELRENQLQTLPKSLSRLAHLTRLDLSANDLADIPEVVGSLTSLTELWVEGNSVRRIPKFIGNLTKLTCLDVANNDVREIADEICKCSQLVDLTLCINSLDSLPDTFPKLENLSVLRLDSNQIEYLPENFGNLKNLTEFSLLHNLLKALPPSIGLLRKLHTLYLDDNLLAALPKELGSCSSLTVLHVAKNRLTEIPSEFGHLSKLKVLALAGNLLPHLPVSLLNISSLGAIWLSESQCKPMLPFNNEIDPATGQNVLTCYLLPQMPAAPIPMTTADDEPVERVVRPSSRSIKFANDPESTVMDNNMKKGLLRAPTPYPKELRAMAKSASHFRQSRDQNGDVMSPDEPEYEGDYAEDDGVHLHERVPGRDDVVEHGLRRRVGGLLDISALDGEPQPCSSKSQGNDASSGFGKEAGDQKFQYRYRHPFHANYQEDVLEENKARVEAELRHLMNKSSLSYSLLSASQSEGVRAKLLDEGAGGGDNFEVDKILEKIDETNKRSVDNTSYPRNEPVDSEAMRFIEATTFADLSDSFNGETPEKKIPPPYHVAARRAAFFRTPSSQDRPPSSSSTRGSETYSGSISGESKYPHLPGLTTQFSNVASHASPISTVARDKLPTPSLPTHSGSSALDNILARMTVSQASLSKRESPSTYQTAGSLSPVGTHPQKQDTSTVHQPAYSISSIGTFTPKEETSALHQSPSSVPSPGLNTTYIIGTASPGSDSESLHSNIVNGKDLTGSRNSNTKSDVNADGASNLLVKETVTETTSRSTVSTDVDVLSSMTNTTSTVTTKTSVLEEVRTPVILAVNTSSKPSMSNQHEPLRSLPGGGMSSFDSSSRIPVLGTSLSKVSILEYQKSPTKYSTGEAIPVVKELENGSSASDAKHSVHQSSINATRIPKVSSAYSNTGSKGVSQFSSSSTLPPTSASVSTPSVSVSTRIPSFASKPPKSAYNISAARIPSSEDTSADTPTQPESIQQPSITSSKTGSENSNSHEEVKSFSTSKTSLNNSFKKNNSRIPTKKASNVDDATENSQISPPISQSKIPTFGSGGRKPWIFGAHKNLRVVALDYKKVNELGFTICNGTPGDSTADKTGVYIDSVEVPEESTVKIGDKLLQVDGIDIANMTLDIVRKVLGNCQENINLMVSRQS